MDNYGFDQKVFEKLKKVYEDISGYPVVQYNWNEIVKNLTGNTKLFSTDWTILLEKIRDNSLIFSMSDEIRKYVNTVKEAEGLSEEEFEKKFSVEIERSRELGKNGWIPTEHGSPKDFIEWRKYIHEAPEKIMYFFEKDDEHHIKQIKDTLSAIYVQKPYITYYQNGIKAFDRGEYMTAAIYFTILLEVRLSNLVDFPKKGKKNNRISYKEKYSDYGYAEQKKKDYENAPNFTKKRFDILNYYPALEEYTKRLFCFGKLPLDMKEESEPEPDYLDRTWLMHGRCCRESTKVDCVQLLNALDVSEFIFRKMDEEPEVSEVGQQ